MKKTLATIAAAVALALGLVLAGAAAQADGASGSCRTAWEAPHSKAARLCRELGWTIGSRLAISPRGLAVYAHLPRCGGWARPCMHYGDERDGRTYWVDADHARHYVWSRSPLCTKSSWCWPTERQQRRYRLATNTKAQVHRAPDADHAVLRFPSGRVVAVVCDDRCSKVRIG